MCVFIQVIHRFELLLNAYNLLIDEAKIENDSTTWN